MFKDIHPLPKRQSESTRITNKYPDRLPIIVEQYRTPETVQKYLVPKDLTVGQFMYVLRKRCNLDPAEALHIFVDNVIPPASQMMGELYQEFKDLDGFLYIVTHKENTFG